MVETSTKWTNVKLGDVAASIQYGYTASSARSGNVRFLRITDIQNGKVNWDSVPSCVISEDDYKKYALKPNDILFVRTGATVGKSFLIEEVHEKSVFASYLIRFTLKEGVLPKYIKYFFNSPSYWNQIYGNAAGIGQPNFNSKKLAAITFPLPPLPDQKRIVAKLDTLFGHLDQLRSRLDKIPVLLKQFRQAVLTQAVTGKLTEEWRRKQTTHHKKPSQSESEQRNGHFPIPEGWSFLPLEHLCDSFQYGTSKKSDQTGKVPVLRMGNIQDGTIDWADLKYTNDTADIATYRLEDGDVLFNRTNSPELVGKSAVYRGERPAIFAGYIIRIKTSAGLDPDFLNYYLASDYGRYWCHSVKTDGVSQSNISAKKLRSLEIPYCSREEQVEIVRRLRCLLSIADNIQSRYLSIKAIISQIPETVLSKAFMGQLIEVHLSSQMKPYVRAGKSRTPAAGREQKGKTAS